MLVAGYCVERPDLWPAGEQWWVEEAHWGLWWVGHCSHDTLQPGSRDTGTTEHTSHHNIYLSLKEWCSVSVTRSRYVWNQTPWHMTCYGLIHVDQLYLCCLYFISEILYSGQNEWYDIIFYIWVTWNHGGPHRNRKVINAHVTRMFLINLLQASLHGLQRKRQWKFCLGCDP